MTRKKFEVFPNTRFSIEECKAILADGNLGMRLKKGDPQLYAQFRADAATHGLLALEAPAPKPTGRLFSPQGSDYRPKDRTTFSDEEIELRARYQPDELKAWFIGSNADAETNNPAKMARENPAEYERRYRAAVAFGQMPEREFRKAKPKAAESPDGRFKLEDRLADDANLPRGTLVTFTQYRQLLEHVEKAKKERQEKAKLELAWQSAETVAASES